MRFKNSYIVFNDIEKSVSLNYNKQCVEKVSGTDDIDQMNIESNMVRHFGYIEDAVAFINEYLSEHNATFTLF